MPVVPHSSNTTSCGQGVNIVGAPGEGARGEDKDRHRSIVRPQVSLTEGMQSLGGGFDCSQASKGDYYCSRGTKAILGFLAGW